MRRQKKRSKFDIILQELQNNNLGIEAYRLNLTTETNGVKTASALVEFMTEDSMSFVMGSVKKHSLSGKEEADKMFQKLFEISSGALHQIYRVCILDDLHSFIIEAENDGNEIGWRVYQSWQSFFTLRQWLNIDPWPLSNANDHLKSEELRQFSDFINQQYLNYGQGKKLTFEQLIAFIHSISDYCIKNKRMSYWKDEDEIGYIKVYNVNQNLFLSKDQPVQKEDCISLPNLLAKSMEGCVFCVSHRGSDIDESHKKTSDRQRFSL